MSIFDIEEIAVNIFSYVELETLVIVRCLNHTCKKICDNFIVKKTQERTKYLTINVKTEVTLFRQSQNLGSDSQIIKMMKYITSLFENNKSDKIYNMLELIFYKILNKNLYDVYMNADSRELFQTWEQIVEYLAHLNNYSWSRSAPFMFEKPHLNMSLFNITTIPLIMKNIRNSINPWKIGLFSETYRFD